MTLLVHGMLINRNKVQNIDVFVIPDFLASVLLDMRPQQTEPTKKLYFKNSLDLELFSAFPSYQPVFLTLVIIPLHH